MSDKVSYDAWMRRNPAHPGGHIYHGCMEGVNSGRDMGVGAAALKLGVSRTALSRVLNGHAAISPTLALKLEAAGWGSADSWLILQMRYDLAQERNRIDQWPQPEPETESGAAGEAA